MGTTDRKAQIKKLRQEDIIDAAEKVFFTKGINNATMDEVAEAAEYSKRTIYIYFSSKEQIYDAIISRAYQVLNRFFAESLQNGRPGNGLEKVLLMGQAYFDFIEKYPNYFAAIANYDTRDDHLTSEDVYKIANYQEGNRGSDMLIACIREGMADGSIFKELDPVSAAFVLYGSMIGIGHILAKKMPYITHTYQKDVSQLKDQLIQMIIRSLTAERLPNHTS